MIIKSIKLNNIRSYIDESIVFNEGSTLLCGDIGSGKSSILLALEFALFGIKRGELSAESILRNGANRGSIELIFELNNKEITIHRTLKRTKESIKLDSNYIVIDNIKQDLTPLEMKSKIYSLLGYPINLISKSKDYLFRFTVYTPQEAMKQILFESSETRLETLRKLFNIDRYKKISQNIIIYMKQLRSKKNEYLGIVSDLNFKLNELKSTKNEIQIINNHISKNELNKKNTSSLIQIKEQFLKENEDKIKFLNELISSFDLIKDRINEKNNNNLKLNNKKTEIDNEIIELKKLKNLDKEEHRNEEIIRKEIYEFNKLINDLISQKNIINEKINNLNKNIEKNRSFFDVNINDKLQLKQNEYDENLKLIEKKDYLEKEIEKLNKKRESYIITISEIKIKLKKSKHDIDQIKNADQCPLCLQNIDKNHKDHLENLTENTITEAEDKLDELSHEIKQIESNLVNLKLEYQSLVNKTNLIESIKTEIKNINEKMLENNRVEKEIIEDEKNIIELKNKLSELKKIDKLKLDLINLEKELNKCIDYNKKLEKIKIVDNTIKLKQNEIITINKDININNDEIKNLEKRLEVINNKIKSNESVKEENILLKNELNELKNKEKEIEINQAGLIKEKETLFKFILKIEEEIKYKEKINNQIKKIDSLHSWFEQFFIPTLNLIEKSVFTKIYREFNEIFERWLSFLIGEEDLSARLSDDFTPIITQNGYETEYETLSGGEKQSIALAYRLALNHVLNTLIQGINTKDILVLDEPTDGFSYDQLDKIRDILDEINIKQIIIVSHEPKIESFVDNVIRINKEGHESKISN